MSRRKSGSGCKIIDRMPSLVVIDLDRTLIGTDYTPSSHKIQDIQREIRRCKKKVDTKLLDMIRMMRDKNPNVLVGVASFNTHKGAGDLVHEIFHDGGVRLNHAIFRHHDDGQGKNGHIDDLMKKLDMYDPYHVVLIDDDETNIKLAEMQGYMACHYNSSHFWKGCEEEFGSSFDSNSNSESNSFSISSFINDATGAILAPRTLFL